MGNGDPEHRRCLPCKRLRPLTVQAYRIYPHGPVYAVMVCPDGHRLPRALPLDPPPPAEDLDRARLYVMGAAAGFALGVQREGRRLGEAVRVLSVLGIRPAQLRLMLGASRRTISRMIKGQYPTRGSGTYGRAADYLSELGMGSTELDDSRDGGTEEAAAD